MLKLLKLVCFLSLFSSLSTTLHALPKHAIFGSDKEHTISSKTIVFIHGMYLTSDSWSQWKSYFEDRGYTVHAPSWPLHDSPVDQQKADHPNSKLGKLELTDVLAHYREFIKGLDEEPILIGHSMGGLLVQLLLAEKLGVAGIAIDSAPPFGVIPVEYDFFKNNWAIISPFVKADEPLSLSQDQFFSGFAEGCLSKDEASLYYDRFIVPESRKVGRAPTSPSAAVNFLKKTQPLLFIAGKKDKTIPASLNYRNFQKYALTSSLTEFQVFEDRCHLITLQDSWEEVADYSEQWLKRLND